MGIKRVVVTNRGDVKDVMTALKKEQGELVCWITIANPDAPALIKRSCKRVLSLKFWDILSQPVTKRQVRKIKGFISNHIHNIQGDYVLVINCHAGISRSAAIGKFCEMVHNLPVQFGPECYPNPGVLKALAGYTNSASAQYYR